MIALNSFISSFPLSVKDILKYHTVQYNVKLRMKYIK